MRLFSPRHRGRVNVRLVSRLADGGRLVSSHGDGRRYLLRLDDAGYRLQQLAGVCRSMGRKRPVMTAQWISARLHHPPPIRPATRVATPACASVAQTMLAADTYQLR